MSKQYPTILVTGAAGHLGQLVVDDLLETQPASSLIVTGRNAETLDGYRSRGVTVRIADYEQPDTLVAAFQGVDRLLLISANEAGKRERQHKNAIAAAKTAGVKLIVYTSILRADTSEIELAKEHLATEKAIRESGIPFVFLRNGWYLENYLSAVHQAIGSGTFAGASAEGKISAASRADFAAAAVAVLKSDDVKPGSVLELAGDNSFTMAQFAAELGRQSGKDVQFNNLSEKNYHELLVGFGLPSVVAGIYSQSDAAASRGALHDDSRTLSALIGRPTTTLSDWVGGQFALAN